MSGIYGDAAQRYVAAGWGNVLPLPPGKKSSPPSGYTGEGGRTPTNDDIAAWARQRSGGNICLRLPDGIIGYDADLYKPEGVTTHADLESSCGPLPATWVSTSRTDGSGIRLYRIPQGKKLRGALGGVEIIQRHHRYAIVWPSLHPEGRVYRWVSPDGEVVDRIPSPDQLPQLPSTWLAELAEPVATNGHIARHKATGEWARSVKDAHGDAMASMSAGSRHDAALAGACALLRLEELGYPGAAEALDSLGRTFTASIQDRVTAPEAEREWASMVSSAGREVSATPSLAPKWEKQPYPPVSTRTKAPTEPEDEPPQETWMASYSSLEFPYQVFPEEIRDFVSATAESVCVHPDMIATFMLPVFAALVGNTRELGFKDDWQERCRVWAAVVSESGAKKSPALKRALNPINAIQRRLTQDNNVRKQGWLDLSDAERKKTAEPAWEQILVDDTTIEALAGVMRDHPRSTLLKKDELTGWVTSHGQYKGGAGDDRQKYLSLWSGDQVISNRKGDGKKPMVVDDPHFNIVGGIQPDKIHVMIGRDDDGLIYRFLFSSPTKVAEYADTPSVPYPIRKAYEDVCVALYGLEGAVGGLPIRVKTTPEGRSRLILQAQLILDEKNDPATSSVLRGYWAKFEAYHLRLALILTELWHVCGEPEVLDETIAELADALLSYFKGQAIALFGKDGAVVTPETERSTPRTWSKVLAWMDAGQQVTTRRAIMRGPLQNMSQRDVGELLDTLAGKGEILLSEGPRGSVVIERPSR